LSSDGQLKIFKSSNLTSSEFIGKIKIFESLNDSHVAFPIKNCLKIKNAYEPHLEIKTNCHKSSILSLLDLENGYILSGSADKTIQISVKTNWSLVDTLEGHFGAVLCLVKLSSNLIASGSDDCTIKIWNLDGLGGKWGKTNEIITLKGHFKPIRSIVYSEFTNYLSSSECDSFIFIWDLENFLLKKKLKALNLISSLIFFFKGYLISGTSNGYLQIWNKTDFYEIKTYHKSHTAILSFCLLQTRHLAIGYADGRIEIVNFFY